MSEPVVLQARNEPTQIVRAAGEIPTVVGQLGSVGPRGPAGADGAQGDPGPGVPVGGTTGQVLAKASNADFDDEWVDAAAGGGAVDSVNGQTGVVDLTASDVGADASGAAASAQAAAIAAAASDATTKADAAAAASQPLDGDLTTIAALDSTTAGALVTDGSGWFRKTYAQLKTALSLVKADVGLGSVDNTSDAGKPVSAAQQTALDLKANLASPALTGNPTAPTATPGDNDTSVATTAFVHGEVATEATARGVSEALLAPLASPALTGNPTAPTQAAANNSTRLATTAYADTADALKANIASPTFTGTPAAPTPTAADSTTKIATTAFVQGELTAKAPLASPTFTGDPKAPTASPGDNDTSLATTAFVTAAIAAITGSTLGTLGYAQVTANQTGVGTSGADLTGLTKTVTVGAGRRIRVSWQAFVTGSANGIAMDITAMEGATVLEHSQDASPATTGVTIVGSVILTPSTGSHTYKLHGVTDSGTFTLNASATLPAWILVEDIGV